MVHIRQVVAAAVGLIVAVQAAPARAAIIPGQIDTFESGTLEGWTNGGASNPNPATNITTGGPAGADDNYMRVSAHGQAGAGGKLVVFNGAQWSGDYLGAGVNAIDMQVNNLGATDLVLRLIFVDVPDGQSLGTVTPVNLPAGSGWQTVSFSLDPSNLSGGSFETVLGNVSELNLVHGPTFITTRSFSPDIAGQLGVDNITAVVPEPGMMTLAIAGIALVTRRGTRRRSTPVDPRSRDSTELVEVKRRSGARVRASP